MTEDWMLPSDWVKKEFPGYTIDELEEACQALRNDFIDDEAFFDEFIRYNSDRQLMDRIRSEHQDSDYDEIVDDFVIPIALEVDRDFVEQYLEDHFTPMNESLSESYLTEAEDEEDIDFELEDEPAEEETEVTVDDIDDDEDTNINEMQKKTIQFPILIEGFDEENNAIAMNEEDEEQYASEYGEAVVQQVEENKKFILSALDIYDLELFYESLDQNSNVKFTVTSSKELDSSILMNILKRYFNVEMEAKALDYGDFTLNPVLDNKFIKIS